jgi:phenylpropionate dioxygenase-like ring-hydroxylating dioxygenase large terminal subunit
VTPDELWHIGRRPAEEDPQSARLVDDRPEWIAASPARIEKALARAQRLPGGGWFILGERAVAAERPARIEVDGHELVMWRDVGGEHRVGPAACPHMGADLSQSRVCEGRLVCPWHGLELGERTGRHGGRFGPWSTFPTHDDGVFVWVRLPGEAPLDAPPLPARPPLSASFVGVVSREGRCEPSDIIANRLDPWHGAHYHPHSFAALRVLEDVPEHLLVRVSYRVTGKVAVEVDATFTTPSPRCITMTIVRGEGRDSVVETHATPLGPGRSRVLEATIATSERVGFRRLLSLPMARRFARPFIEARARQLWIEDVDYAERTYALRSRAAARPSPTHLPVVSAPHAAAEEPPPSDGT